jgi:hypothetical protein
MAQLERDVGGIKSEIAVLENKVSSNQTDVVMILRRFDRSDGD